MGILIQTPDGLGRLDYSHLISWSDKFESNWTYEFFYKQVKRCKDMDDLIFVLNRHLFLKNRSDGSIDYQAIDLFFEKIEGKLPVFSKYRPTDRHQLLNSLSWDDQYVLLKVNNSKGEFDGFISERKKYE